MGYCYMVACASGLGGEGGEGAPAGMTEEREYAMGKRFWWFQQSQMEGIIDFKESRLKS